MAKKQKKMLPMSYYLNYRKSYLGLLIVYSIMLLCIAIITIQLFNKPLDLFLVIILSYGSAMTMYYLCRVRLTEKQLKCLNSVQQKSKNNGSAFINWFFGFYFAYFLIFEYLI